MSTNATNVVSTNWTGLAMNVTIAALINCGFRQYVMTNWTFIVFSSFCVHISITIFYGRQCFVLLIKIDAVVKNVSFRVTRHCLRQSTIIPPSPRLLPEMFPMTAMSNPLLFLYCRYVIIKQIPR